MEAMISRIKLTSVAVIPFLKDKLMTCLKNYFWVLTLAAIFIKTLILLSIVFYRTASIGHIEDAFQRISFAYSIYIFFIICLLSFAFLFKGNLRILYLLIANFLISAIYLLDLWHYRGFGNFLSIQLIKESANLDNLSDSILSMGRTSDILMFVDLIPMITLAVFARKQFAPLKRSVIAFILFFAIPVFGLYYIHYTEDIVGKGIRQSFFKTCWTPDRTILNLSPIGYHVYDVISYWEDSKVLTLTSDEKTEIKNWFNDKKENLPDNPYYGLFKGKNLIFIQVESLEAFVLNRSVNQQEITPNLNKLLNNSLYFPNFYEQVNNGTSSDSDLMVNTSIYPVRRGSTFFRYPNNTYNSLPKMLEREGYSTIAIHPDKGAYWNYAVALKSIGFQRFLDASYFSHDEDIGLGLSDESYFRQVEPVLKEEKKPFYAFLVTLTSHSPFNLPKNKRALSLDQKLDKTKLGGYFQSVNYTDHQIGSFINKLDKDGILDNSVIVIFGDHTGIHKYYSDELLKMEPNESWWLYSFKHIPLIIYQKNLKSEKISTIGGQIDTLPTVAYLMGIDKKEYSDSAMGRNLLNTKKSFAVLSDKMLQGSLPDKKQEDEAIKGVDIADKILRSNYFKDSVE